MTKVQRFPLLTAFIICTCVSVRRRDRCTRTPPLFYLSLFHPLPFFSSVSTLHCFFVLVCLSTDVTGALVLSFTSKGLLYTCVSAHRRDRCTCTLLHFFGWSLLFPFCCVSFLWLIVWIVGVSVHRRDRCTPFPNLST